MTASDVTLQKFDSHAESLSLRASFKSLKCGLSNLMGDLVSTKAKLDSYWLGGRVPWEAAVAASLGEQNFPPISKPLPHSLWEPLSSYRPRQWGDLNGLGTLVCAEPQLKSRGIHLPLRNSGRLGVGCPAEGLRRCATHLIKGQGGAACVAEAVAEGFAPANCPHVYHGAVYGPCGANS